MTVLSIWKGWPGRYVRVLSNPPLRGWVIRVGPVILGFTVLRSLAEHLDHDTTATWLAGGAALGGVEALTVCTIAAMRTPDRDSPTPP